MVNINVAYTQPVNPPGVTPVLTREQVWAGMERKARRAHDFVPVFEDCVVVEEHGNVVVRETKLKSMEGRPGKTQRETCKLYKPTKVCLHLDVPLKESWSGARGGSVSTDVSQVDFYEDTGAVFTNMVSDGPGMTDEELSMTYFFEWLHPDLEAGSDKEKELTQQHKVRGKMSVDKTIQSIRKMVVAGQL